MLLSKTSIFLALDREGFLQLTGPSIAHLRPFQEKYPSHPDPHPHPGVALQRVRSRVGPSQGVPLGRQRLARIRMLYCTSSTSGPSCGPSSGLPSRHVLNRSQPWDLTGLCLIRAVFDLGEVPLTWRYKNLLPLFRDIQICHNKLPYRSLLLRTCPAQVGI